MKNLPFIFLVFIFCWENPALAQESIQLLRYPALNTDGSKVAFSFQGDIWTADAKGGVARRLTIHESYESNPQWSPDNANIAFQGNRYGNNDLFVMPAEGGAPQRLTHHSAQDASPNWADNDQLYFSTRRTFAAVDWEQEIYSVSRNGGTPQRALDALGYFPAPSPGGRYIAFTKGSCRKEREAYRGPANKDIWLYDTKNQSFTQLTTDEGQDLMPDWADENTLYFLSARTGRYNIYVLRLNNKQAKPQAVTSYKDEGVRHFDVSAKGGTIVYEYQTDLYLQSPDSRTPKKLSFDLTADYRFDPEERKTFTKSATDYSVSPNGDYLAFVVRGEVFVTQNDKEKKRSVRITDHPYRDQDVQWLNDTSLLFISDRNGNKDIYMARSTDPEESDLFKTFKREVVQLTKTSEDESGFEIDPTGNKIAIMKGRGKLEVHKINADGQLSEGISLLDGWDTPEGVSWSPDGKWLAYALHDLNFNEEVYIHAADNSRDPVNVSMHPRGDDSPRWSADGSKLGFLSIRNNGDRDVWFVWLKKEDWEKTQIDWEEEEEEEPASKKEENDKKDKKDDKDKKKDVPEPIQIDFEDIHQRLVQVTRIPGNEGNLAISKDGETFFFTTNGGGWTGSPGDPDLMSIKWNGKELTELVKKHPIGSLEADKTGKYLYYIKRGGMIERMKIEGAKTEGLPFQAKMLIDYQAEREQIFTEAWRSLRDGFYDPDFHGQDWDQLYRKYKARSLAASTSQDFRTMFNEMLGQLNASHMGLFGSDPEETQKDQTGLLGIEVKPLKEGVQITKIVADSPADKTKSKLRIGEIITMINGEKIEANQNFFELLNGTADEEILLSLKTEKGEDREVIIRPASSIRNELYQEWVNERKQLTERYSKGRLGYIHIQGMNWGSFERFERELMASGHGKEGIVIDVRNNGGGWTTDMLMAVLNVRQHAYTIPRGAANSLDEHGKFKNYYPFGERLPLSSWTKPSIALCNQNSYSNAEIFSHAYKTLDIGTLVGIPTFGAVISTGGQGLLDGSFVRMPFRAWYVKATGENMENGPAVPDIIINNPPDSRAKGEDPQLKKAAEELLDQLSGR
jgi:tricorn protease